jgi:outer membrane immunogenic protein
MNRLAIAIATIALIGTSAFAADMAVKAPLPAPTPVSSWTGFYFGINAGVAWGLDNNPQFSQTPVGFTVFDPISPANSTSQLGGVGGFQAGYNWQFAPSWLLGVEGDFSWVSGVNNNITVVTLTSGGVPQAGHGLVMGSSLDWLSSARARLGYVTNNYLWYVTGGGAWGEVAYSGQVVAPGFNTNSIVVPEFRHTSSGWVAGGGVEVMATANVLLRLEYLFYQLSSGPSVTAQCPACTPTALDGPGNFSWGRSDIQVVRAALSYKF